MAKASMIALVSFAICLSSFLNFADAHDTVADVKFVVYGNVYCDTCRVEFMTKISQPIQGAQVRLECRNRSTEATTYSKEAVTDESGLYRIAVEGDHEEEICEVSVVKSPVADCNETMEAWKKARIVLTNNNGISDPVRFANSLGFMKKEALPQCAQVLKEMGFLPLS